MRLALNSECSRPCVVGCKRSIHATSRHIHRLPSSKRTRDPKVPCSCAAENQTPMAPPSLRVTTNVAERGRLVEEAVVWLSGQALVGAVKLPFSPGCCTLQNKVLPSGVTTTPVISQSLGPTRKRRTVASVALAPTMVSVPPTAVALPPSPTLPGTAASIMQLVTSVKAPSSVWIHNMPRGSRTANRGQNGWHQICHRQRGGCKSLQFRCRRFSKTRHQIAAGHPVHARC